MCQGSCKYCLCFTNRNFFRISCIFLKEILGLKEVNCIAIKLVSGRRRIQIQVHLAGKPTPFPSLPTYRFLQAYGVLVLFRNQENPHRIKWAQSYFDTTHEFIPLKTKQNQKTSLQPTYNQVSRASYWWERSFRLNFSVTTLELSHLLEYSKDPHMTKPDFIVLFLKYSILADFSS